VRQAAEDAYFRGATSTRRAGDRPLKEKSKCGRGTSTSLGKKGQEAPLRPPWLTTAGDRFCAHSAQMAPADHGIEHLVCGHKMENWSLRLIPSSTLSVDA